jgi:hypothetical protein
MRHAIIPQPPIPTPSNQRQSADPEEDIGWKGLFHKPRGSYRDRPWPISHLWARYSPHTNAGPRREALHYGYNAPVPPRAGYSRWGLAPTGRWVHSSLGALIAGCTRRWGYSTVDEDRDIRRVLTLALTTIVHLEDGIVYENREHLSVEKSRPYISHTLSRFTYIVVVTLVCFTASGSLIRCA